MKIKLCLDYAQFTGNTAYAAIMNRVLANIMIL